MHTELVANLTLGVVYLTQMGNDLRAGDIGAIQRWRKTLVPKVRRSERWYNEWATDVGTLSSLDGISPPAWLKTMDRWN